MRALKLSVLILTHNRPKLFEECINSLLKELSINSFEDFEIIVNNDSNDITEIPHSKVRYYYSTANVNDLYEYLYDLSTGEYIMYLEDDDIIMNLANVLYNINQSSLHIGLYKAYDDNKTVFMFKEYILNKTKYKLTSRDFALFQLSQIIFKKTEIQFPTKYHNENDEKLLQELLNIYDYKLYKDMFFEQGIDNKNLSLKEIICSNIPKLKITQ